MNGITRVRQIVGFLMAVAMLVASIPMAPAAGAQAQTITSQLTGVEIAYSAPYSVDPEFGVSDENGEMIAFAGYGDVLALGFLPATIDLVAARDVLLGEMFTGVDATNTIDRGNYSGVSYSLDITNFDGVEMGVFSLFLNQRSHGFAEFYIYIAPPSLFGSGLATAQNSISVNGEGIFGGIDAASMGTMVTNNVGSTGGTAGTDVSAVEQSTEESTAATEETTSIGQEPATEEAATEETTTGSDTSGDADAYLTTVTGHREVFVESFATFATGLSTFSEATSDADKQAALQATVDEAGTWQGYLAEARAVTAPAGYEAVHDAYLSWASAVTELGDTWISVVTGEGATAEDFSAQLEVVNQASDDLDAALAVTGESADTAPEDATEEATDEATSESSRSTRSTSTKEATEEATSESSRSTRSTSTEEATEEATSESGDPSPAEINLSETSGTSGRRTSTESTSSAEPDPAASSWEAPETGLTIAWNDEIFGLAEENAQTSDTEVGRDYLELVTSENYPVSVYVGPSNGNDVSSIVDGLTADDAAFAEAFGDDAEWTLAEQGASNTALLVVLDPQEGIWLYVQFACVDAACENTVTIFVTAYAEDLPAVLDQVNSGITVDGEEIPLAIPVADVEDSIAEYGG